MGGASQDQLSWVGNWETGEQVIFSESLGFDILGKTISQPSTSKALLALQRLLAEPNLMS